MGAYRITGLINILNLFESMISEFDLRKVALHIPYIGIMLIRQRRQMSICVMFWQPHTQSVRMILSHSVFIQSVKNEKRFNQFRDRPGNEHRLERNRQAERL